MTFAEVTALGAIFAFRTALALSCNAPTLFVGSAVAAYETPPSATNSATSAMTSAGLGRRVRMRCIDAYLSGWAGKLPTREVRLAVDQGSAGCGAPTTPAAPARWVRLELARRSTRAGEVSTTPGEIRSIHLAYHADPPRMALKVIEIVGVPLIPLVL